MFAKLTSKSEQKRGLLEVGEFKSENFLETTSFELLANLPIIEVEISGQMYKFLFDSAALSVIPNSLVERLFLSPIEEIVIDDSLGNIQSKNLYSIPSLKLQE